MNATPHPVFAAPPARPRRRWLWPLLCLLFLLCGLVGGAALGVVGTLRVLRRAAARPEHRLERAVLWCTRRLDLDADQQARLRVILEEQARDLAALRAEATPRVHARLERTHREIAEVLHPDQREHWRRLTEPLSREWQQLDDAVAPATTGR